MYEWKGSKVIIDQALDWPRAWADDGDFTISSDEIPTKLKYAHAEAALRALSEDLAPDIENPGVVIKQLDKVGPIATETQWTAGSQVKRYRHIDLLVRHLVRGFEVVRT